MTALTNLRGHELLTLDLSDDAVLRAHLEGDEIADGRYDGKAPTATASLDQWQVILDSLELLHEQRGYRVQYHVWIRLGRLVRAAAVAYEQQGGAA